MDPIQVQLLNDGAEGHDMAWLTEHVKKPNGMPIRDSLMEVVEVGKKAFDWDNKWHPPGTRKTSQRQDAWCSILRCQLLEKQLAKGSCAEYRSGRRRNGDHFLSSS